MFFDNAEGMVFRPPSEANSLILRVTIGCSHNACTFCNMYRDVKFRIRDTAEMEELIKKAAAYYPTVRRVFLADGNALAVPTPQLLSVMDLLHSRFKKLARITCYGAPKDILRKRLSELKALKAAGLQIIYLGIESGDNETLQAINKGVTAEQMVTAGQKVLEADIKLSAMVILGLGGHARTQQHAIGTAKVVNAINPTMLSALTLMLTKGTSLREQAEQGQFQPLSPYEFVLELKNMLQHISLTHPCIFRSNHVSNFLPLAGTLPQDKDKLVQDVEEVLRLVKNKTAPTFNDGGPF